MLYKENPVLCASIRRKIAKTMHRLDNEIVESAMLKSEIDDIIKALKDWQEHIADNEEMQKEMERRQGLLPCPYCGGMADLKGVKTYGFGDDGKPYIECGACGARTKEFDTPQDAAMAWNSRKQTEQPRPFIEI